MADTKNTDTTVAAPAEGRVKRPQVNTTLEPETFEKLKDIRFARRADKLQDVVREAIVEFVEKYSA